jgi:hypothetical protein
MVQGKGQARALMVSLLGWKSFLLNARFIVNPFANSINGPAHIHTNGIPYITRRVYHRVCGFGR